MEQLEIKLKDKLRLEKVKIKGNGTDLTSRC
jgi:hypothetical protein